MPKAWMLYIKKKKKKEEEEEEEEIENKMITWKENINR